MDCTRRDFLAFASTALMAPRWLRAQQETVHAVIIYDDEFRDTAHGALIACDEAERTAQLLRRPFRRSLVHRGMLRPHALRDATHLVAAYRDIVVDTTATIVDAVTAADEAGGVCRPNVWHIPPLLRDRRVALESAGASTVAGDRQAVAWHGELERFGAGQLNARFRADGIAQPGPQHWCGWMAIKCIWESALRTQALSEMTFDGHKGRRLYFGARSHNLVQPVYVVQSGKLVHEWSPPENAEDPSCGAA